MKKSSGRAPSGGRRCARKRRRESERESEKGGGGGGQRRETPSLSPRPRIPPDPNELAHIGGAARARTTFTRRTRIWGGVSVLVFFSFSAGGKSGREGVAGGGGEPCSCPPHLLSLSLSLKNTQHAHTHTPRRLRPRVLTPSLAPPVFFYGARPSPKKKTHNHAPTTTRNNKTSRGPSVTPSVTTTTTCSLHRLLITRLPRQSFSP